MRCDIKATDAEIQEMEKLFPGKALTLITKNNGYPLNLTKTGESSTLFRQLNEIFNSKNRALVYKSVIYLDDFKSWNTEPDLTELFSYIERKNVEKDEISIAMTDSKFSTINRELTYAIQHRIGRETKGIKIKYNDDGSTILTGRTIKYTWSQAFKIKEKFNKQYGEYTVTLHKWGDSSVKVVITPTTKLIQKYQRNSQLKSMVDEIQKAREHEKMQQIEGNWYVNDEGEITNYEQENNYEDYLLPEVRNSFNESLINTIQFKTALRKKLRRKLKNYRNLSTKSNSVEIFDAIIDLEEQLSQINKDIKQLKAVQQAYGDSVALLNNIAENDFNRVMTLIDSGNFDALNEAEIIIEWYERIGRDTNDNPLFFGYGFDSVPPELKNTLIQLSARATTLRKKLNNSIKELARQRVLQHPNYSKLFDREITVDELFENLDDIDWISSIFYSINWTLSGKDSIIPQTLSWMLETAINDADQVGRNITESLNALEKQTKKELLKNKEYYYDGKKNKKAIWNTFYAKDENGNTLPYLVTRFKPSWYNWVNKLQTKYANKKYRLDTTESSTTEQYNEMYSEKFKEITKKAEFINPAMIPAIVDNPEFRWMEDHIDIGSVEDMELYENRMISIYGKDAWENMINDQIQMLREYRRRYERYIRKLKIDEGIQDLSSRIENLSDNAKRKVDTFIKTQNPLYTLKADENGFVASDVGHRTHVVQTKYNVFAPHMGSEFFDNNWDKIENNPIYHKYWKELANAALFINSAIDDAHKKLTKHSLLSFNRGVMEMMTDKRIGFKDRLIESLGITKDNITKFFTQDFEAFRDMSKNEDEVYKERFRTVIEKAKVESNKLSDLIFIAYKTLMSETSENISLYDLEIKDLYHPVIEGIFAEYFGIPNNEVAIQQFIEDLLGKGVAPTDSESDLKHLLDRLFVAKFMQRETFNLPEMMKYFLAFSAKYAGQARVAPVLRLLKNIYAEQQQGEKLTREENIESVVESPGVKRPRVRAAKRVQDWFLNSVLGRYKAKGIKLGTGKLKYTVEKRLEKAINNLLGKLGGNLTFEDYEKLESILNDMGKSFDGASVLYLISKFIILKALVYNPKAGIFNFIAGRFSNKVLDELGVSWNTGIYERMFALLLPKPRKSLYKGLSKIAPAVARKRDWKGKAETIAKIQLFMSKAAVITDPRNELQKASVSPTSSTFAHWKAPLYFAIMGPEFRIQGAASLAVLSNYKIKDRNGKEYPMVDKTGLVPFEIKEGKLVLKDKFRYYADGSPIQENIDNWETMTGPQFKIYQSQAKNTNVLGQGDYAESSFIPIKGSPFGKLGMTLMTWIPMFYYLRFGKGMNLALGINRKRGMYAYHNPTTGALAAIVMSAAVFGVSGATIGFGLIGALTGYLINKSRKKGELKEKRKSLVTQSKEDIKTILESDKSPEEKQREIQAVKDAFQANITPEEKAFIKSATHEVKEMLLIVSAFVIKVMGGVINPITMRTAIRPNIEKMLDVDKEEAGSIQAILYEISLLTIMIAAKFLAAASLRESDCTDKEERLRPDDCAKIRVKNAIANYVDNSILRIIGDITLLLPINAFNSFRDGTIFRFLDTVGKLMEVVANPDKDYIKTGQYAGRSKLWMSMERLFLPSVLADYKTFQRDYTPNDWVERMLWSNEETATDILGVLRSKTKMQLTKKFPNATEAEIQKMVSKAFPTLTEYSAYLRKQDYLSAKEKIKLYDDYINSILEQGRDVDIEDVPPSYFIE